MNKEKREIKFRAWDKRNNEMVYSNVEDSFYVNTKGVHFMYKVPNIEKYIINYDVMQYTGLRDKNNTEIYEGDICKTHKFISVQGSELDDNSVLEVVYIKENMSFGFVDRRLINEIQTIKNVYIDYWQFSDDGVEVIGNIYENKDLL